MFKPGDRVQYLDVDMGPFERDVVRGDLATVVVVSKDRLRVRFDRPEIEQYAPKYRHQGVWEANRFRKLSPAPPRYSITFNFDDVDEAIHLANKLSPITGPVEIQTNHERP